MNVGICKVIAIVMPNGLQLNIGSSMPVSSRIKTSMSKKPYFFVLARFKKQKRHFVLFVIRFVLSHAYDCAYATSNLPGFAFVVFA